MFEVEEKGLEEEIEVLLARTFGNFSRFVFEKVPTRHFDVFERVKLF